MSNHGKQFTEHDMSKGHRRQATAEQIAEWCRAQTERYRIVAIDRETNRPIIAEEIEQRALNKLPVAVKRAAGMLNAMDPELRRQVLAQFDKEGKLILPFDMVD